MNQWSSLFRPRRGTRVFLASLVLVGASASYGADVAPLGAIDAAAGGDLATTLTPKAGAYSLGLHIDDAQSSSSINAASSLTPALKHRDSASLLWGLSPADVFSVSIGVHGDREPLAESLNSANGSAWHFTGASLLAKLKLIDWQGFRFVAAPFAESAGIAKSERDLDVSSRPKAGWMAILSYGERGVGEITGLWGYRYRNPELVVSGDSWLMRNEAFYAARVKAELTPAWAIFAAGEGRSVAIAPKDTGGYRQERAEAYRGGLEARFGDTLTSAYVGASAGDAISRSALGYGAFAAGINLTYTLGGSSANADGHALVLAAPSSSVADFAPRTAANNPDFKTSYPEMAGKPDYAADLDVDAKTPGSQPDDYEMIKARMDQEAKAGPSDEEKMEDELVKLRAAEARAEAVRERQERVEARRQAIKRREDYVKEQRRVRALEEQAKKDAANLPSITPEDASWRGLEN